MGARSARSVMIRLQDLACDDAANASGTTAGKPASIHTCVAWDHASTSTIPCARDCLRLARRQGRSRPDRHECSTLRLVNGRDRGGSAECRYVGKPEPWLRLVPLQAQQRTLTSRPWWSRIGWPHRSRATHPRGAVAAPTTAPVPPPIAAPTNAPRLPFASPPMTAPVPAPTAAVPAVRCSVAVHPAASAANTATKAILFILALQN